MSKKYYEECLRTIFKLKRFGIKLGLSKIKKILKLMGNPQNNFHSIHIAGTNGKGSIASNLATILKKANYKVGLYTSPHIVNFNERINVNGFPINNMSVAKIWNTIKLLKIEELKPTFFELTTAIAFYYFELKKVDFAIIETGMGGKHDATNILSPLFGIITNISLEHKKYLGSSIKQITKEKSGIIKKQIPIISGITQKKSIKIIKDISKSMNSKLIMKGKDFNSKVNYKNEISYLSNKNKWNNIIINLLGTHQINNATITLAASEILKNHTYLTMTHIRSGLKENKWPGRIEIIKKSPIIILDGAHNMIAARKLNIFIKKHIKKKITLIISILDDKSYKAIIKSLSDSCSRIIVTQAKNEKALCAKKLKKTAKLFNNNVLSLTNSKKALKYAIKTSKKNDVICVAGSLYLIGEIKKSLIKYSSN